MQYMNMFLFLEADPQSRLVVSIVFAHVVRPSVPTFQNKTNVKRKQCLPLARLWVWPSGSLMTPVLSRINSLPSLCTQYIANHTTFIFINEMLRNFSNRPMMP